MLMPLLEWTLKSKYSETQDRDCPVVLHQGAQYNNVWKCEEIMPQRWLLLK